jgi:hypothetical protein
MGSQQNSALVQGHDMIGFGMHILRMEIDGQFQPNKQNCKILETCTFLSKTQK